MSIYFSRLSYQLILLSSGLFRRIRNDIFSLALKKPQLEQYLGVIQTHMQAKVKALGQSGSLSLFDLTNELTLRLNGACFAGTYLLRQFVRKVNFNTHVFVFFVLILFAGV